LVSPKVGKHGTKRSHVAASSYLIAGLAGGAIVLAPLDFAGDATVPGALPPLRESVSAVHAAIADLAADPPPPATAEAPAVPDQRRLASAAAAAVADDTSYPDVFSEMGMPARAAPVAPEPPLQLTQMLVAPPPGAVQPRWMSVPRTGRDPRRYGDRPRQTLSCPTPACRCPTQGACTRATTREST
jgi:hypothetical protein